MRGKPIKCEYKVQMCNSNGYNLRFETYTSKIENLAQKEFGANVVLSVPEMLVGNTILCMLIIILTVII